LAICVWLAVAQAGLVDDIINAVKNGATCAGCHALLVPLAGVALLGDRAFAGIFVEVCKGLTDLDDDVCTGAVGTQAPALAHVLRTIDPLGQSAKKLCDALLGLCQPPAVNAYTVPLPAEPATPKLWVSTGKTPLRVVHFSDVHIDRRYTVGADAVCTKPVCCRKWADDTTPVEAPAGAMGMRNCDTPTALIQNFLNTIGSDNKFSIFTGDVIEATVWLADQPTIKHDNELFANEIATLPDVPVYPAVGNHESSPTNQFPRKTTTKFSNQWLFDTLGAGWKPIIGAAAANQVIDGSGSYALVVPGTSLRIVSVNTVYWYKTNWWLYDSNTQQPDPNGVLAFVVAQLKAAEDAGQRAWIVGHIPPGGRSDVLHDQSNYFNQIVQRFKHVIAGQFYGHSHVDEFMVGYSDYSKRNAATANGFAMVAPAFTPRSANPGYKVYDVDPDTYEIMDVKVFRANTAASDYHTNPVFKQTYSARATYGPKVAGGWKASDSLNATFWHKVTEAFETDTATFDAYRALLKPGGAVPEACDAECKRRALCDMRALRAQDRCTPSSPGLNLRRDLHARGEPAPAEGCKRAGFGEILQAAAIGHGASDWEALRPKLEAIIAEAQAGSA